MRRTGLLLVLTTILLIGCSSRAMDDFERNPADHGLLHALQTADMKDPSSNGYTVTLKSQDEELTADGEQTLILQVTDPSGKPVEQFTPDMTKLFHLMVVRQDLSTFAHLHPEYEGNGTFHVAYRFPYGGKFLLISEFQPNGKDISVYRQWVEVSGTSHPNETIHPDPILQKTVDGVEVTLSISPELSTLKAGQTAMLNFHLADAATHQAITGLQPYLGTPGHAIILNASASRYLHVHAMEDMSGGADVMFHTIFPASGTYKIWGQFQVEGKVIVAPFVLQVNS